MAHAGSLNAFRRRASRGRRSRRARGDVLLGFLHRAAVDFDGTFEVRTVFDHDLRRRQIPDHRTFLLDLDPSLCAYIPLYIAVHHHVAGVDVRHYLRRCSDGQLPPIKMDLSIDRAVDQQILRAGDVALHTQARSQPPRIVVPGRSQWTHRLCWTHRIGALLTPHRTLLETTHPSRISRGCKLAPRSSLQKFPASLSGL